MGKRTKPSSTTGRLQMEFDLKQLAVFVEVADRASFSGAARALNLAQASVSERIATLERALGARLLDRLGRKAVPTHTGRVLLARARALLDLRNETMNEIREVLDLTHGQVVFGASSTPGDYVLPALVERFKKDHPMIAVRLIIRGSEAITRQVESGALEFGVVGDREKSDVLTYKGFSRDRIAVAVAASHPLVRRDRPLSPTDLLAYPMVLREPGSGTRAVALRHLNAALKGKGHLPEQVTELGSTTALIEGVKAGLGFTLISERAIRSEVEAMRLEVLDVQGLDIERRFFVVHDRRRTRSPAARALMRCLGDWERNA